MIVEIVGYVTNMENAKHLANAAIIAAKSDILLGYAGQTKRLDPDGVAGRLPQQQATIGLYLQKVKTHTI
jgi:hypothetical protein